MSKREKWKDIPKDIISVIIKIEAFKIMFPDQYEKLLNNLQPNIDQIVETHTMVMENGGITWH